MTTEAASTPAPKRKGLVIAIAATLVVAIAGAVAWPVIAKRQKVSGLRESAHEAFLKSDWLTAVSSLHEAAQLRPTDSECRRDYEDMQDKWLRYVQEVLSGKKLGEVYAFHAQAGNKRIRDFLTEPVRTKYANMVEKANTEAAAVLKAALAGVLKAADTYQGAYDKPGMKEAYEALDAVKLLAPAAQAEYDRARETVVLKDWRNRLFALNSSEQFQTDKEGKPLAPGARAQALIAALEKLRTELRDQKLPDAVTARIEEKLQRKVLEQVQALWVDRTEVLAKEKGFDGDTADSMEVPRAVLAQVRGELEKAKSKLPLASYAAAVDALKLKEFLYQFGLVYNARNRVGAHVQAAEFDQALALVEQARAEARVAATMEGAKLMTLQEKAQSAAQEELMMMGEPEKPADPAAQPESQPGPEPEDSFLGDKAWQEIRSIVQQRAQAHELGELVKALEQGSVTEAQHTIDRMSRLTERRFTVTGEALVGEKDFQKFLGYLAELGMSPAKGQERDDLRDVLLIEKLRDRFSEPGQVQHFLSKAYADVTGLSLKHDMSGMALYFLQLGHRSTGFLDTAQETEAIARFAAQYPLTINYRPVQCEVAGAAAAGTPAWNSLLQAMQQATKGWIKWSSENPTGNKDDMGITLAPELTLPPPDRQQITTTRSVRYQSGTQQVPNPAYQQVYDQLQAAQQEYQDAINTANQAQATLDQASASGDSNGAIWAGAAALTARTAQGYAQGKRDNLQRALNGTPRTIAAAAYADESYQVTAHRHSQAAVLTVNVEYALAGEKHPHTWNAAFTYSAEEITGNAKRGVPVKKPLFLGAQVLRERLGRQLTDAVRGQLAYTVRTLAAEINALLTKHTGNRDLPNALKDKAVADFAIGRAMLWQKAGINLGFAEEETALRQSLGLPGPAIAAKPADDLKVLPGYAQENSLGMIFRPVPGTRVLFSQWETRVQDFSQFVQDTGHKTTTNVVSIGPDGWKQRGATWQSPGSEQGPEHPVVGVSWQDAQAFCDWLTKRERAAGLLGENQRYRLPTDDEWSLAVGLTGETGATPAEKNGKQPDVYPWGREWPVPLGAGNYRGHEVADADWPSNWVPIEGFGDGYPRTAPVGSYSANAFGLFDLGGNVEELCQSLFSSGGNLVVRGSCWAYAGGNDKTTSLNSSARNEFHPTFASQTAGFRVVLALTSEVPAGSPEAMAIEQRARAKEARDKSKVLEQQAQAVPLQPFDGQPINVADLKLAMLPVKPGYFLQGTPLDAEGKVRGLESPGYAVITRGFWLGQTEVTQAQWQAVMKIPLKDHMRKVKETGDAGFGDSLPMYHVTWEEAMEFCRKLTERERAAGRLPAGYAYTLPTEAQWEYACRAGTTGDYAGNLDDTDWYAKNSGTKERSFGQAHPVGQKRPNAWGFYDMHGNVGEACLDGYHAYPQGVRIDYTGPATEKYRVVRGGYFMAPAENCRSGFRYLQAVNQRTSIYGFRVTLSSVL